jgi:hypothetical protein
VLELARCDWIRQSANCCLVGHPGIGRCHREAFRVHRPESAAAEDLGSVVAALEPRTSILKPTNILHVGESQSLKFNFCLPGTATTTAVQIHLLILVRSHFDNPVRNLVQRYMSGVELNRFAWTESLGVGWLSGWCRGLFLTTFQVVRACQVVLNLQVVRARTIIRAGQVALIGQVVRAVMLC